MKINEVEARVGVTKKNIRYYEAEGLLAPRRQANNGYRSYSEEDVATLQKIKLLRKLDVPIAEVRAMLEGQLSLREGMARHRLLLENRRAGLEAAARLCETLQEGPAALQDLDAEAFLTTLSDEEKKGVPFVNIQKTDRRQAYLGAVLGASIFLALMAFAAGVMIWAYVTDPAQAPPLPLMAFLVGMPLVFSAGVIAALVQRFKEIRKGEEDDYRNY